MHEVLKIGTHTQQSKPLFTIFVNLFINFLILEHKVFINTISLEVRNYSNFRVYKQLHKGHHLLPFLHDYMECICSN